MTTRDFVIRSFIVVLLFSSCHTTRPRKDSYDYDAIGRTTRKIHRRVEKFITSSKKDADPLKISRYTRIDSLYLDQNDRVLNIHLNKIFGYIPLREESTRRFYEKMGEYLGWRFSKYDYSIYARDYKIEQLVPNYYRADTADYDLSRFVVDEGRGPAVVRKQNRAWYAHDGLENRNIALWHSHGWYYEQRLNRWEWQRARLFQTVEDLGPMAFTIPYLIPMLENAGANVFVPRERDPQINEVVVDNDLESADSTSYIEYGSAWRTSIKPGFAKGSPPYTTGVNPFELGSSRFTDVDSGGEKSVSWIPEIPEKGMYAVYISYYSTDSSATDAAYTVFHAGGSTEFLVNQKMGGGTWIYLGTFKFATDRNANRGSVRLNSRSNQQGAIISADAVRFGGGMGNVSREGQVSGRPRFVEAARYYLQYAGMPDTLVFNLHADSSDYRDDYKSRGEWVNYLKGAPYGPNLDREDKGLGIPVDISLAFHTDAGISNTDTVIGTLSIYSTFDADTSLFFPDSVSRLANRDFADIMQTQIVEDIRAKYDPAWKRRGLWDSRYHEAFRPNVPSVLLELLSHQNLLDMEFALDPRFRFDVSRSIYKAMLRFLATQYSYRYVVQPLPVNHMFARFTAEREVTLSWQAVKDDLEPTAMPTGYVVYTRLEDNGFDNGRYVDENHIRLGNLEPGKIYSYKVTGVNTGGESFPSEILSVCWMDSEHQPVLVINGFDRISAPAVIKQKGFQGFADFVDQGVPDRFDLGYTGRQFNFEPGSKWKNDDAPGFGASYGDMETTLIAGNTFDFPYLHGRAIRNAGFPFVSASDEAVMADQVKPDEYTVVDLILGEEKTTRSPKNLEKKKFTAFPLPLMEILSEFCKNGGNLLVSGSYIGSDLYHSAPEDSSGIRFATGTLKIMHRTGHAAKSGAVAVIDSIFTDDIKHLEFNTTFNPEIYAAEAPDGIEPVGETAATIMRYSENNISAAVAHSGANRSVVLGFPFESITDPLVRNNLMKAVLKFLDPFKARNKQ